MIKHFIFILLLSLSLHATYLEDYLYDDEIVSDINLINISISEGEFSLVKIKDTLIFVLIKNAVLNKTQKIEDSYGNRFLNDIEITVKILQEYYGEKRPSQSEIDEIYSAIESFNKSRDAVVLRYPPETKCKYWTGIDKRECIDKETCMTACLSTPICRVVLYGARDAFLNAMMEYSIALRALDSNISAIYSSLSKIGESDDPHSTLLSVIIYLNNLKKNANTISKSELISKRGFAFCPPVALNTSALDRAIIKATLLKNRIPSLSSIREEASRIINKTKERIEYAEEVVLKLEFEKKYTKVVDKRISIESKITEVKRIFNLTINISSLLDKEAEIKTKGDAKNYSNIDKLIEEFYALANATESKADELLNLYNEVRELDENFSFAILKVEWIVSENELLLLDVNELKVERGKISLALPINSDNLSSIKDKYIELQKRSDEILKAYSEIEKADIGSFIGNIAKAVVRGSLGVIYSFFPMTYSEKKEFSQFIIPLYIILFDIIFFALIFLLFAHFVGKGHITLHKKARILWSIIFLLLFMFVGVVSAVLFFQIHEYAGKSSMKTFVEELALSDNASIIMDVRYSVPESALVANITSTIITAEEIKSAVMECASSLSSTLISMNKTTNNYTIDNVGCWYGNESLTLEKCFKLAENTPIFYIHYDDKNSTTFYTFYETKADIRGDINYLNICAVAKVIK